MLKDILQQGDWMCSVDTYLSILIYRSQWHKNIVSIVILYGIAGMSLCVSPLDCAVLHGCLQND